MAITKPLARASQLWALPSSKWSVSCWTSFLWIHFYESYTNIL